MPYAVRATLIADRQIRAPRGARLKAYLSFEETLGRQGCAALDYRLTGEEPLHSMCVKHLRGRDRVVVAFSGQDAWILLVGQHDAGSTANDVYALLYVLAGATSPSVPRTKPPCCDGDSNAPDLDVNVVSDLVQRARALVRERP